jgi:hypothetical protein
MSKMQEVIDAGVPEADHSIVRLHASLILNTRGGRPSDAARDAVTRYQRLGRHAFIAAHYADHTAALRACGCAACLRDLEDRRALGLADDGRAGS